MRVWLGFAILCGTPIFVLTLLDVLTGSHHTTFEHGQWFHGQMYPRRSDLSPDGKFLVYFCAKWSKRRIEEAEAMLDKNKAGALTHDLCLLLKRNRRPELNTPMLGLR